MGMDVFRHSCVDRIVELENVMEPRELVQRLQLTAVKARSNAAEPDLGQGNLERAESLDPLCYSTGEMSMLNITEKMLEGGREPTAMDVYNLLALIDLKSPSMQTMYFARWDEELPNGAEYLKEHI